MWMARTPLSVLSCLIRLVWHSPYLLNLVFFPGRARSALLPYQDFFILFYFFEKWSILSAFFFFLKCCVPWLRQKLSFLEKYVSKLYGN